MILRRSGTFVVILPAHDGSCYGQVMALPCLAFCPYLHVPKPIAIADWEIGPVDAFADRWADDKFRKQSEAFLGKFVDENGKPIEHPSIVCRRNAKIDGTPQTPQEFEALVSAIDFAFLDGNPQHSPKTRTNAWSVLTSDHTEFFVWPVDVNEGEVVVTTGLMVRTKSGGYRINDNKLIIRPPLDLHASLGSHSADEMCLKAVYKTVLSSATSPGANKDADRIRVAIGWFAKAWRNTATVHYPERVVFLKTAFEALTATSESNESAAFLRTLFEGIADTQPGYTEQLVWSPDEKPVHERKWKDKKGVEQTEYLTDLQLWFMAFAQARNDIIHQGASPSLDYTGPATAYHGHFVFTAEFLLRGVIKVMLGPFGFPDVWRSAAWRAVKAACEELEQKEREAAAAGATPPRNEQLDDVAQTIQWL